MAQVATQSPLSPYALDSALQSMATRTALSRESSPWSKFLSPSLFALEPGQRSTPLPAVVPPTPSPLKQSHNHPSLFTHAKEINPFEQSFSHPAPNAAPGGGAQPELAASFVLGTVKRKRAMSSPALWTPGGTGDNIGESLQEAFLPQAKRPSLRLTGNGGLPSHMVDDAFMPSTESVLSLRSSANNSFDETMAGGSLLRHRRGRSLVQATVSPDSSIAPSPYSHKDLASPQNHATSAFTHYQPAPLPVSIVSSAPPYADHHLYVSTTMAPTDAHVPLPFAQQGPVPTFHPLAVQPHLPLEPTFAYPLDPYGVPPFPLVPPQHVANYTLAPAPPPVPHHAFHQAFPPIPISALPPVPAFIPVTAVPSIPVVPTIPIPIASTSTSHIPPPPAPILKKSAAPKSKVAKAASPAPSVATGPSAEVSADGTAVKPKPPGKKRGRKPKNWDPTLERQVELDPEEQENQRKLALERNRVAASKSRRRKKERVEQLESASSDLCTRNIALQAECRQLLAEVHSLRNYLSQSHPAGCTCTHINGYLAREADGGGIPSIFHGAGKTLDADYTHGPTYGNDDDLYGELPDDVGGSAGASSSKGKKTGAKSRAGSSTDGRSPVVGGIPLKPLPGGGGVGKQRASIGGTTGEGSSDDEEVDGEGGGSESEEETLELKSRRARAIPLKHKDT